jgi:hypothetical protein
MSNATSTAVSILNTPIQAMLNYDFMRNAFAAATVVVIVSRTVGCFLVLSGQTFAGYALSHVERDRRGADRRRPTLGLLMTLAAGLGMASSAKSWPSATLPSASSSLSRWARPAVPTFLHHVRESGGDCSAMFSPSMSRRSGRCWRSVQSASRFWRLFPARCYSPAYGQN